MDAKTLEHLTVPKLREEALKFGDIIGVHGMNKAQLIEILKQKYGIHEVRTESEVLAAKRHRLKKKIRQLKAEKAQALADKNTEKFATLRTRLHQQRRILKKVVKQAKMQPQNKSA